MYSCHMVGITPTSVPRREVAINSPKLSGVNAVRAEELSHSLPILMQQVVTCYRFLKNRVPGFENSMISGLAPRIGVRETRRIGGEYVLRKEDVFESRVFDDSIALGGHPIDLHRSGTDHTMADIPTGGAYGIPYRCLLPLRTDNLLVAGRCLSSTREANGSARVMGTCMAMGQAAGTAAALAIQGGGAVRDIDVDDLREMLNQQGALTEQPRKR